MKTNMMYSNSHVLVNFGQVYILHDNNILDSTNEYNCYIFYDVHNDIQIP